MERRADTGKGKVRLAPRAFSTSQAFSTPALLPAHHGLLGIIEVDGIDHLAAGRSRLQAALAHLVGLQPQDGGHGALPHRHRFLHGLGAKAHQRQRIGQRKRPGSHQGGVLAQRMSGHRHRRSAPFRTPRAPAGNAGRQHHGLGVGGEVQVVLGAAGDQRGHVFSQGRRGFFQRGTDCRVVAPGVQHAHGLGSLAGKYESKRCHRAVGSEREDGVTGRRGQPGRHQQQHGHGSGQVPLPAQ